MHAAQHDRPHRPSRPAAPHEADEPPTRPALDAESAIASRAGEGSNLLGDAHAQSETDAASLSPWTGVGSPSSSDFEAISDSEVRVLPSAGRDSLPSQPHPSLPVGASNLTRSLRTREDSYTSSLGSSSDRAATGRGRSAFSFSGSLGRGRGERFASVEEDERHRRGVEGDDEDSSAFEDAPEERGRGRTRRRDPELKRSMLEEALRSSITTLLSLAPAQAHMSQTPSISHVSLASLFSSSFPSPSSPSSAVSPSTSTARPAPAPPARRQAPFAFALEEDDEDDEPEELQPPSSSSAEEVFLSSSSDEEGTQLALHPRAIPISASSSRSRSRRAYSDAYPSTAPAPTSFAPGFSPLQPSRPLGATSDSPPLYSRRRGSAGLASRARRGRGRGGSKSPGPASVEERRRARAVWAGARSEVLPGQGYERGEERRGGETDGERDGVERDEAFAELLDAARFFSDLSPRASRTSLPSSSSGLTYTSASASSSTQPLFPSSSYTTAGWTSAVAGRGREGDESTPPPASGEESDPALASESVPTLSGGASSGDGEGRSPSPVSAATREKGEAKKDEKGEEGEKGEHGPRPRRKRTRILGWLKGLGERVVEIKAWQLVGICGVLIGVGLGAGSLLRSLAASTPLLDLLNLSPSATASPGSLIRVPPRLASFTSSAGSHGAAASAAASVGAGAESGGEGMSSLFL
ncbi:hypothetical protein JCM10207_006379 [Rhodosporidiobolus poonsookiae]